MKKNLVFVFLLIIFLFFNKVSSGANEDLLLKSDFKAAYIEYSSSLKNEKSAENYLNMCRVTYMLRDNVSAKQYCKEALNYIEREKKPDPELKSNIFLMLGTIYSTVYHNNDITFDYLNQAKELKELNPDTDKYELALLYKNLGYMYNYAGNSILSENYYKKALDITENSLEKKYNAISASIYNDFAKIEKEKQNYEKSKEYLDTGIEKMESSQEYLNYALLADLYKNTAEYYELNKHSKTTAVDYYKKAANANKKYPDKNMRTSVYKLMEEYELDEIFNENEIYPYDINTNLILGFYNAEKDEKVSDKYFEKAAGVNPENPLVYADIAYLYALLYLKNNKIETEYLRKAKEYIKVAEIKGKYDPDTYFNIADTSIKLGSSRLAAKYFKKYMEYYDNKLQAVNNIQSYFAKEKNCFPKELKDDILK